MHAGDSLKGLAGGIAYHAEDGNPGPSHPGDVFRAVQRTERCPVRDALHIDTLLPCVYEMFGYVVVVKIKDGEPDEMPAARVLFFALCHAVYLSVDFVDRMFRAPGISSRKKRADGKIMVRSIDPVEGVLDHPPVEFIGPVIIFLFKVSVMKIAFLCPPSVKIIEGREFIIMAGRD
jgi:hypothetical protein